MRLIGKTQKAIGYNMKIDHTLEIDEFDHIQKNPISFKIYLLLTSIFVGTLIVGAAIGSKLVTVLGVTASASAFTYPVTFLVTDCVAEIWGKKPARQIVLNGFYMLILALVIIQLVLLVPASDFFNNVEGFDKVFGTSSRLLLAGTIAYLVSQTHDVWAFHFWKAKTNGKHLWLRNNLSTIVSQLIDTAIFVGVGFLGIAPFWDLFVGQFLLKAAIAILDTPFAYLAVYLIRRKVTLSDN